MTPTSWRKSSRSSTQGGQCLETRQAGAKQQLRDSKLGGSSPIMSVAISDFAALLDKVNLGSFVSISALTQSGGRSHV